MNIKYFFWLLVISLSLLNSCDTKKEEAGSENKKQTENPTRQSIIGKWGGLGEAHPIWDIRKDSIYYFQRNKAYAYQIVNNNMLINFENSRAVLKSIYVKRDTLFFVDDAGISVRGFRFK